jgi:hypothetical protein
VYPPYTWVFYFILKQQIVSLGALSTSNPSISSDILTQNIAKDMFDTVQVDYYNQTELHALVNFYKAHKLLLLERFNSVINPELDKESSKIASPNLILKLFLLTGGNPKKLARCANAFLY